MTNDDANGGEQLELLPADARGRKSPPRSEGVTLAEHDPVARVLVDVPLAHLDRPFDYSVPETMADVAVPGARVKVRFAGRDVNGYVLERAATTDHGGRLQPLRRAVSAEPVLSPEIAELTADVAHRYAGTRSDVLRLAVPPRHARTEQRDSVASPAVDVVPDPAVAAAYDGGADLITALADGRSPRAVWTVLPGDDGLLLLAEAVVAAAMSGRGALVCVPDHRDLDRLDARLTGRLGEGGHVVLSAEAGPSTRYRAFLAVARGAAKVVIGTRAAAFAPVHDLGLVAVWDDGDDLYAEPRAPYPHTREVLLMRAQETGCAAVLAAHARSCEAEYLVRTGWATSVAASRDTVRERVTVSVTGDSDHDLARDPAGSASRTPKEVFETIRGALVDGPVLVQTPRSGYALRLACDHCRTPARCRVCDGPLRVPGRDRPPECTWCGTAAPGWTCSVCGGHGLRAPVRGDRRTAEELGRAFATVPVRSSSGGHVLGQVPDKPALVVATPGAEPTAEGGYTAVVLLDTWLPLARTDLRASEEAVRRWTNAAALVRPGGRAVLVGDPALAPLQAMVRWDPAGFARREIAERQSAHLPPASRVATVTIPPGEADDVLDSLELPAGAEVLGPVPVDAGEGQQDLRYVVRVPRSSGAALADALREMQGRRSTRKLPHVRVQVDPVALD